jgi:hypothetical protein
MNPAMHKMSHVQAEIEYLKVTVEEQKAIIKQLVDGPGEVEYIHPYDLYEIINNKDVLTTSLSYGMMGSSDSGDITIGPWPGKKYRQSALIPARTKKIK